MSYDRLVSAGKPAGIRIRPERDNLAADGQSLCFVVVEIIDQNGNIVPTAKLKVTAKVEGAAALAAFEGLETVTVEIPIK